MKAFTFSLACLLTLSGVLAGGCYSDTAKGCYKEMKLPNCTAAYAQYHPNGAVQRELRSFTMLQLKRSYDYLLSASYFNNFRNNRGGFSKLFRKLSDDAWEKTISVIKQITKRGGHMEFSHTNSSHPPNNPSKYTVELYEFGAIANALDTQKELAERAFYIHREANRNNTHHWHDPQLTHYLEEEIIEYQANTIRDLAGYLNDIKMFVKNDKGDLSLALYLFDEYLKKAV